MVSWWFCRIVNLVVVCNCSSLSASKLALVSLILWSISFLRVSVALILSLSSLFTSFWRSFLSALSSDYNWIWDASSLSFYFPKSSRAWFFAVRSWIWLFKSNISFLFYALTSSKAALAFLSLSSISADSSSINFDCFSLLSSRIVIYLMYSYTFCS